MLPLQRLKRAHHPSLPKFQFESGEYYIQCATTSWRFLALQGKHIRLDDTQKRIPTCTGLVKLLQNQDGSTVLYSSLNNEQLKVDNAGEIVTVSQANELEDFELFQAVGNGNGQLIIRSIQTETFVRVSQSLRLCADVTDPKNASKFVLKSRYLIYCNYNSTLHIAYGTLLFLILGTQYFIRDLA